MAILDEVQLPLNDEIEAEALALLLERLGPARSAVFLHRHFARPTDYVAMKAELFPESTVAELMQQIQGMQPD